MSNFEKKLNRLKPDFNSTPENVVLDAPYPSQITQIAQKINTSGLTPSKNMALSAYEAPRADIILNSLTVHGYEKLIQPTEIELKYVAQVFQSKKFHLMDNITYPVVSDIGNAEFSTLNKALTVFTSKMSAVKTPGLFTLIDTLSKDIQGANLEDIWTKTVNAKPSLMARFKSLFNPSAKDESLNDQFKTLYSQLTESGKGLEVKLGKLEVDLRKQKRQQEDNIRDLESSFNIYYNTFTDLRKQFILIVFLEESFKNQFETFKSENLNTTEITVNRKLQEYEQVLEDIANRRMILHGALLKLPITVHQNTTLIGVCKKLSKEVDSVLENSFPTIRGNLVSLGVSLNSQQSMIGTQHIRTLDAQLSQMSMAVGSNLAIQVEKLSSETRLKEAKNIQSLVLGLKKLQEDTQAAKEEGRVNMDQAQAILDEATNDLKEIINPTGTK